MRKEILIISVMPLVSGCVSTFEAIGRDPVRVEKVEVGDKNSITAVALSAEKRNVVVGLRTEADEKGIVATRVLYCAEPPPEVAKAFDIDRSAILSGSKNLTSEDKEEIKADIKNKVVETITTLGQRTALLDVYRTATYSLCQFYMNGAIDGKELSRQFDLVTKNILAAFAAETVKPEVAAKK